MQRLERIAGVVALAGLFQGPLSTHRLPDFLASGNAFEDAVFALAKRSDHTLTRHEIEDAIQAFPEGRADATVAADDG